MNNLADSHKRTSISQLLNPLAAQDGSAAFSPAQLPNLPDSIGPNQVQQDQQGVPPYHPSFSNGSSFNLRAANWELPEDATKRKPENGATAPRHYHQPQMNAPDVFVDQHGPRMVRPPRMDDSNNYAMDGQMWPPQQGSAHMPYGTPVISPMYSDERTALSDDFQSHNNYNHGFQEQSTSGATTWQSTERASVRLAARGTMQEPQNTPQEPRYSPSAAPLYYQPPPNMYNMAYQPTQLPQAPQKRPLSESEEAPAPKVKKVKAKPKPAADGNTGPSKRGYNAKKRSEAAQIAAQNAQLMPTVSYTQVQNIKGKEKAEDARMRIVSEDGAQHPEASGPLHPELQFARCMSNRYKSEQFPRCVSCTRRWAGDTCRFQGIRFFLKDHQRNIVGISFVESQKPDAPTMIFPTRWNVTLLPAHIQRTKATIAKALLPTLRLELEHLSIAEIIRRPRESDVRATCDTCMTSLFSSSWMCRLCGREACAECFEQVKDLTIDRPGAGQAEIAALQSRREKHAHSNPFFLSCTRRNEHQAKDFSPMSRFCKTELSQAIEEMEKLLGDEPEEAGAIEPGGDVGGGDGKAGGSGSGMRDGQLIHSPTSMSSPVNVPIASNNSTTDSSGISTPPETALSAVPPLAKSLDPGTSVNGHGTATEIPSHTIRRFTDSELTDDVFRPIWAKGEPLLVTDLLEKFKIQWTPEYFLEQYNTQSCLILECQTDENKRVTVGEFFSWFGKYEGRSDCWKLKDWPPSTDFRTAFPELYEDFSRAVPVPNYVRRDGALNIASHFPSNTVSPDLGPKMYNAMAAFQVPGSKGSTRLHMDMADALNIMTFASPAPDGSPGCAAWDLFRAGDSDKIRGFLRKRFSGSYQQDPIHSQQYYLDEDLRRGLWEECGVMSYRVYQRPGEAVFIPAGCAHQVSNIADCVKVAVDFVSPENIERCEKLTREFREQNQLMVWKEDVLQLRTMMWFAWLSCCRQEA